MTDIRDQLAAIKARAAEATPGPWEAHGNTVAGITGTGDCGGCSGILSPAHEPSCYWSQIAEADLPDAEFIAHARTDVDRLTEALEEVLRSVEKFRAAADFWNARYDEERQTDMPKRSRANALNICAEDILRAVGDKLSEEGS